MRNLSLFDDKPPPKSLKELGEKWSKCRRCFFSVGYPEGPCVPDGSPTAKVLVVGQWPGQEDMKTGIPFSGPQGLVCREKIMDAGFREEDLYYTNVLLCPCPMEPTREILRNCNDQIEELVDLLAPELFLALGAHAARRLGAKEAGSRYRGVLVATCTHPAAIARAKSREEKERLSREVNTSLRVARSLYE